MVTPPLDTAHPTAALRRRFASASALLATPVLGMLVILAWGELRAGRAAVLEAVLRDAVARSERLAGMPDTALAALAGQAMPALPGGGWLMARRVEPRDGTPPPVGPARIGAAYQVALDLPGTRWRLVQAVPAADVEREALRIALPRLGLILALALVLAGGYWLLLRHFVRPALALVGMLRAEAGAADATLPAPWRQAADRLAAGFAAQKRLVAELRAAEALKSGVIAASLDAVVTTDRDLRVIAFNPAAERMFGWTEAEALGRSVGEVIVPPRMRPMHDAGVARWHATRAPHVLGRRIELPAQRRDGTEFPVEVLLQAVEQEPAGLHFTAFLRDLTPMREAEAELARQRDRLHQAEKLSALGSLLAGVAHELNNPLSVVTMQATLLEELAEGTPLAERAERIHAAAQRCARIVRTFLGIARQQAPRRGPVRVNEVLRGAVELIAYGLRTQGVTLEELPHEELPVVEADADQLVQVAVNLLVNAQQALAARAAEPRRIRLGTTPTAEGGVRVTVEDNGPGVPAAIRARIFEPYFTTKPLGAGTGIGLAVCRNIVAAHGGTLEVDDSPALGGARFTLTLPPPPRSHAGEAAVPGTATPPATPPRAGAPRVLIVDDEAEVAETLAAALRRLGFVPAVAAGAAEAEALLARVPYDLVFCDLRMPGGGGAAVWRAALAGQPALRERFVMMTGDMVAGPAAVFALDPAHPPPILEKPFGAAELSDILARMPQHRRDAEG